MIGRFGELLAHIAREQRLTFRNFLMSKNFELLIFEKIIGIKTWKNYN
jgi:hypothetical protein